MAPATFAAWPMLAAMWSIMMAAMMVPAMVPVVSIYARLAGRDEAGLRLVIRIMLFMAGYLLLWGVASLALALLQVLFAASGAFSAGGTLAGPLAASVLLIAAGLYQFSAIKSACLAHCRHPLTFLIAHWREGVAGAFPLGLHHGLYCVGCCIVLMGLMFVFGAMNVWWMAVLTLYFILEKIAPKAEVWGRAFGALLCGSGAVVLLGALAA